MVHEVLIHFFRFYLSTASSNFACSYTSGGVSSFGSKNNELEWKPSLDPFRITEFRHSPDSKNKEHNTTDDCDSPYGNFLCDHSSTNYCNSCTNCVSDTSTDNDTPNILRKRRFKTGIPERDLLTSRAARMIVASCDRSPHSAKNVIVKDWIRTRIITRVLLGFTLTVLPAVSGSVPRAAAARFSCSSCRKWQKWD